MKTLKIGLVNRVYLDTDRSVDVVKITIISTKGEYAKKNNGEGTNIDNLTCNLDAETGKYYYDITFHADTIPEYYFIYWTATYQGINVELEAEFAPEDIYISEKVPTDRLIIVPSYVMDNHLRGIDKDIMQATFNESYQSAIRKQIKASTSQLESQTEVYFLSTLVEDERHDYDMSGIYEKYWQNILFHSPIISIEHAKLKLNDVEIVEEIPTGWVQIGNKKQGLVKIMPYAGGFGGLAFIYKVGFGIAVLLEGAYYIPDFFSFDYYAGLDWDNLGSDEKEEIRNAISRRVALNLLPNLDVHRGISSESKSIDGGSVSTSYTSSAIYGEHSAAIETWRKEEKQWIQLFKKRYLTRLKVA